jgi:hypothetical protein
MASVNFGGAFARSASRRRLWNSRTAQVSHRRHDAGPGAGSIAGVLDDEELTAKEEVWVDFWVEAGRARMHEFEAAIMAADVSDEEKAEALRRFRESIAQEE